MVNESKADTYTFEVLHVDSWHIVGNDHFSFDFLGVLLYLGFGVEVMNTSQFTARNCRGMSE